VASDRAYQNSVKRSRASPIKQASKIGRSASCLSPSKLSTPTKAPLALFASPSSHAPSSPLPSSSPLKRPSLAAVSDNELEAESGVLENQMISCYLAVLLGFLLTNLSEPRRFEVSGYLCKKKQTSKQILDLLNLFRSKIVIDFSSLFVVVCLFSTLHLGSAPSPRERYGQRGWQA